jgi:hypothetical protein
VLDLVGAVNASRGSAESFCSVAATGEQRRRALTCGRYEMISPTTISDERIVVVWSCLNDLVQLSRSATGREWKAEKTGGNGL